MQQSARNWEAQAQDSLVQLEQLKGLLEESAFWQSHPDTSTMLDADPAGNRAQSTPTGESEAYHHEIMTDHSVHITSHACCRGRQQHLHSVALPVHLVTHMFTHLLTPGQPHRCFVLRQRTPLKVCSKNLAQPYPYQSTSIAAIAMWLTGNRSCSTLVTM